MKNVITLFLTAFLSFSLSAQSPYNKMLDADTTTWQHFGLIYGVKNSTMPNAIVGPNSIAVIDTITINSYLYKKVYQLSTPAYLNYASKTLIGYTREDSTARKIYFKENLANPEFLLYDFSLNVNDYMMINFTNAPFYNGYYKVDSIITKIEMCGPRKHFFLREHLNNINPTFNYFEFIEGIGSTYHFLYTFTGSQMTSPFPGSASCAHKWSIGLACKKNKSNQQFQSCTYTYPYWNSFTGNSCVYFYYTGGITENIKMSEISIFPNPSSNNISVKLALEKKDALTISVINVLGQIVISYSNITFKEGENTFEINTSSLQNGVYSVVIENEHFKNSYPIVIQN